ncbi:MAG: AMP-binding protein, partial [Planctomycetota bacterium]
MTEPLWKMDPEKAKATHMHKFIGKALNEGHIPVATWNALYRWSTTEIEEFWSFLWDAMDVIASEKGDKILEERKMPGARWFPQARLNFAENLLRYRDDRIALISLDEDGRVSKMNFAELHAQVARCADALKSAGVREGDRIAGFVPNVPQAVIAMLATTSMGAIWSSCSADFGIQGVLDRFGQIEPKVLFTADAYRYNGKTFDSVNRIADLLRGGLEAVEHVVVIPFQDESPDLSAFPRPAAFWDEFLNLD